MSMADQYDDGRYDPNPGYHPDGILAPPPRIRPRRANAWGAHPQYTPPQKGKTMALTPRDKVRKLEAELDSNLTLQQQLKQEEQKLREGIRVNDIPPAPPKEVDKFAVTVQFTKGGPQYTYLIARNANRFYTTGVSEEQKRFDSWSALAGWLNSTYSHSALFELTMSGRVFETQHDQRPPF